MANAFSKEEIVFFERVLEGFNPNNITARQVSKFMTPSMQFERSNLQVWRPVPYISRTRRGLTLVSADFTDMTQLSVPSSLNASDDPTFSDVINVPFTMNTVELNDVLQRDRKADSAVQALSARIDVLVATAVAQFGSLFVKETSPITKYQQVARCEEVQTLRDVPLQNARTLVMNAKDYNGVSGDLANRSVIQPGITQTAFERSRIPMVATFDSFKSNFQPTQQAANTGVAYLLNGAGQNHVPVSTDATGNNVDNRYQDITVDTGDFIIQVGDAFTIAGLNAVSLINKNDFTQLQTFRVVASAGGTGAQTITITPPMINVNGTTQAEKEYGNVATAPADNAALTFLNTVTAPSNIFWMNEAVEITHGSLSAIELDGSSGVASMRMSTDSGLEILFAKGSDIKSLGTEYRLVMWARPNVLIPDMCGNLVGNQT